MASRSRILQAAVAALATLGAGCIQSPSLTDGQVYVGRFPDKTGYQPFTASSGANVVPDFTVCFPDTSIYCPDGGGTLRVVVPGPGDPENAFAGGTIVADVPRNLSGYDAVSFWAKSTRGAPVVIGLGADQSDDPRFIALGGASLGTEWTQYVLPIPLPSRLTAERGLFFFSAGAFGSPATGFTFWLADIQYVTLGTTIGGPYSVMPPTCVRKNVGDSSFPAYQDEQIPVGFAVQDRAEIIGASNRYFTFTSSDPAVATVDPVGRVAVQGNGTAIVTAQLGGVPAAGPLTVKVGGAETCPPLAVPTDIAPPPTVPAADVISMFSSAYAPYTSQAITWQTSWSLCCNDYAQVNIPTPAGAHPVKRYGLRPFAGIEFIQSPPPASVDMRIDASAMNWLHVDVWTPNGYAFELKLVNDPGGFQSESTVRYYILNTGTWTSLEIPMTAFRNLGGTSRLGQMLFLVPDGTSATFYVDNIYFHK